MYEFMSFLSQPSLGSSNLVGTATKKLLWMFHEGPSLSLARGALERRSELLHEAGKQGEGGLH